jgi:Mce-associated membrane protein
VSDAVKAVFSYDYANLPRTERAASDVLTGDAVGQYRDQFASARTRATAEKLVRTTTVRAVGVRTLVGDDASLLLFLDQQTVAQGGGAPSSSVAQLAVTAKRIDGHWKLATLAAL